MVYKIVSFRIKVVRKSLNLKEKAQNWLNYSLNDPLVKILVKNSNLTKIQLETLLIDVLAENITDMDLKYDEKAKLRILAVSRGAFNRSLRQARYNFPIMPPFSKLLTSAQIFCIVLMLALTIHVMVQGSSCVPTTTIDVWGSNTVALFPLN